MDEVYRAMLFISKGVFGQSRNVQDGAVLSVSYHDSRERTVSSVSSAMPSGFLVTETSYSNTDRPLAVTSTHYRGGTAVNTLSLERKYDAYDRQSEMTVRLNGAAVTSSADTYSANGRLAKTAFGNPRTLQVAYSHTTRGDLASVTAPGFTQTLVYSADSCRAGNIRVSSWKGSDGIQRSYRFSYDGLNRLTRALYSESGRSTQLPYKTKMEGTPDYTESIAYDISSNPVRIRRKGITEVPANALTGTLRFGLCDDITLGYSGQRLVRADDSAPECGFSGAMDFLDGASETVEYAYDASGNMLSDSNKGIDAVTYNRLNRPQSVEIGGHTLGFVHDASGNLLQRTHRRPIGGFPPAVTLQQDIDPAPRPLYHLIDTLSYCGPFEYSHSELSRVNFPGGYVSGGKAYHYIYDHQGNVRQVVDAATGSVDQENHYYPGGMLFAESSALYFKNGSYNLYRYGEKEFLTSGGLNLSLHGARMYDPALVRFITPDPLCHQTPHLSPYLYCAANPVMLTDPTGWSPIYSTQGQFLGTDDEGLQGDYYIMEESHFEQNMKTDAVQKYAVEGSALPEEIINTIETHFNKLPERPDYDGYLTLDEANSWYRNGNGETLYADLRKIDLSGIASLGESYVGQEKCFNLLTGASHCINDGLVYGNIHLKRFPNHTVRANADIYDFDIKAWSDVATCIRNIETIIGSMVAGKGQGYTIIFYGTAPIRPINPYIK